MFSRRVLEVFAIAMVGIAAMDARAAPGRGDYDGCAVLGQLITSQIDALSPGMPSRLPVDRVWETIAAPDAPGYCASTAATVSKAFGGAMLKTGIVVTWGRGPLVPVDYCMDHYLPHCYPIIGPPGTSATAQELSFVHDAWKAVSRSVMGAMPYGVGSDMAVFDRTALGSSMAGNLRFELAVEKKSPGRAAR